MIFGIVQKVDLKKSESDKYRSVNREKNFLENTKIFKQLIFMGGAMVVTSAMIVLAMLADEGKIIPELKNWLPFSGKELTDFFFLLAALMSFILFGYFNHLEEQLELDKVTGIFDAEDCKKCKWIALASGIGLFLLVAAPYIEQNLILEQTNLWEFIVFFVLGMVLFISGVMSYRGNLLFTRWYSKTISEKDIPKYRKCMGVGIAVVGISLIATAVLKLMFQARWINNIFVVGVAVGAIIILIAQLKYNKKGFF